MKIYSSSKSTTREDRKKYYEIFNETISESNVKRMGELIALNALKFSAFHCGSYYEYLYKSLLKDIFNHKEREHVISDGYDYAQEAILFLCHFIGKNPKEVFSTDKSGKEITIWLACARYVSRIIARDKKRTFKEETVETISVDHDYKTNKQIDEEQKSIQSTIRKMKLTKAEKDVLKCYMAGMTFVQIAKCLSVDNSTVWHRRRRLQNKYITYVN